MKTSLGEKKGARSFCDVDFFFFGSFFFWEIFLCGTMFLDVGCAERIGNLETATALKLYFGGKVLYQPLGLCCAVEECGKVGQQ